MTNEIISMNELDIIAGGNCNETANDSFELYERKLIDDHHNALSTLLQWESISDKVDKGWAKAGVHVVTNRIFDNEYSIDGKKVDRQTALEHLQSKFQLRQL